MRVLIAHNRYRHAGGEERHVGLLEEGLSRQGHSVRLLVRDSAGLSDSPSARARAGLTMAYSPAARTAVRRAAEEWKADVVHFHNISPLLTPAALRGARDAGAAVVLTLHNYRFACASGTLTRNGRVHSDCLTRSPLVCALRNPRDNWVESLAYGVALEVQRRFRLLARWADAFVAPSRFLAAAAVAAGLPAERVHVIRNGVDLPSESEWRGKYALFTGRLSREKGLPTLVTAASLSGVPVQVAGDGPLAREPGTGDVRYLGHLEQEQLTQARERAAFVVVPSECPEVAPLAVLEAAAAGRAAIVTEIGGLPELVDDGSTGFVVPPGDPARLADAMRVLWSDPDRAAAMGQKARARAAEHFTVDRLISELVSLYAEVRR
jgi:glycosyltransferase involved in cell wall biosynthesis